ncbi:MAG: precorrin-2 C(20)-methyltransferase [Cyanobacteria bacterium P01_D01_bin.115]
MTPNQLGQPQLGQLWGVGVGPGDPELMTLKAARLLQSAPVIAFPAGRGHKPGIAQKIIASLLQPDQVQLPLHFPYVQEASVLEAAWQTAADIVWAHLATGQDVVFATEGDASFYSTFTYLVQTLQQHHPDVMVQTVPGVCSPLAAAALLGEPLTILDQRLTILPALYQTRDLEVALDQADKVVLMKVASVYPTVWQILKQRHLLTRSTVVVRATQPDQQIYRNLEEYPNLDLPYFSLLIVHGQPSIG